LRSVGMDVFFRSCGVLIPGVDEATITIF